MTDGWTYLHNLMLKNSGVSMPQQVDPNSKKSRVIAHFKSNPEAAPAEVAELYGLKINNVYTYKSIALKGEPKKAPRVKKAPVADASVPTLSADRVTEMEFVPPAQWPNTDPVSQTSQWPEEVQTYNVNPLQEAMPHWQYVGYLRGKVLELVAAANGSSTMDLANARVYLDKLIDVT